MANIDTLQDFDYFQAVTSANQVLSLDVGITAEATTLQTNFALKDETGATPTKEFFIGMTNAEGYTETMKVTNVSGTKLTVERGMPRGGIDFTGDSSNAVSHKAGFLIKTNIYAGLINQLADALLGNIGATLKFATRNTFRDTGLINIRVFADATARDAAITSPVEGDTCLVTSVAYQYYDGVGWIDLGTATAITASDGTKKVGQNIQLDTADTDYFKTTTAGAPDEGKIVLLNTEGLINQENQEIVKDLTATPEEINQALDGINPTVDAAALNVVTGGESSNGDSEHTHLFNKKLDLDTTEYSDTITTWKDTYTYTLPANTLAAGKGLNIKLRINANATGATGIGRSEFRVTLGGTVLATYANQTSAGSEQSHRCFVDLVMVCTGASAQTVDGNISITKYNAGTFSSSDNNEVSTTQAVDITTDQDIKVQVQNTTVGSPGSGTSLAKMFYVELIK